MTQPFQIHTLLSQPFAENSYVLWREGHKEALVIDPGLEPELILQVLGEFELNLAAILNTHGHADHIAGNAEMKRAFPQAPLIIGANETHLLADPAANLSALFGLPLTSPAADRTVVEGDHLQEAGIALEVLDLPGHSPGHIVFLHRGEPSLVFSGDVLFRGSIGRVDFPGCDGRLLLAGIRDKLLVLPDDTIIYPGHGPVTTVGHERHSNPFLQGDVSF
jgi:hydroxyacylglutathione hydrolase